MPWKQISKGLAQATSGVKNMSEQIVENIEKGVGNTVNQVKDTVKQVEKVGGAVKETVQEFPVIVVREVEETIQDSVKGIQNVAHTVNQGFNHTIDKVNGEIADTLDKVVGEKGKVVSDFIRSDGIQTVAGFAFTPVYIVQRGMIGYEAFQAFDRGDIVLGELVVRVISPATHSTQQFLKDPENQEMISQFITKVIPSHIQQEYIDAVIESGQKVGGFVPETPQEKIRALLMYRKPSLVDNSDEKMAFEQDPVDLVKSSDTEVSDAETSMVPLEIKTDTKPD